MGRMPRGNQLSRQWRLLQLIDRPAGITVEDAAQELFCAVRTIWRDLRVLQAAGFPLYGDPGFEGRRSVWRVTEQFRRRLPLKLTLGELAALLMSRDSLVPFGANVLGGAVQSAFDRIAGLLSRDAVLLLDRMRETIGVRTVGAKLHAPQAVHLARIQLASSSAGVSASATTPSTVTRRLGGTSTRITLSRSSRSASRRRATSIRASFSTPRGPSCRASS
jgi:predicted DNA-binding transcriptional regulator YafY